MNTIKKVVGIALLLATINITGAAQASASIFDWVSAKPADKATTTTDSQSWSFDSLYQAINGISLASADATAAADPTAVTPVTSPASSTSKTKTQNKTIYVTVTGYSSTPDQTDDTPFITASGTYVRDGIVAANFLPFGTAIKIPELYGNKVFIVEDRMNSRYWYNVDVWFASRNLAKQFGVQKVKIEIVS